MCKPAPIFILGMPRSGTTLVEQIISSHSEVNAAGELSLVEELGGPLAKNRDDTSFEHIMAFREKYLLELRKRSGGRLFVTDKMPQNFLYIGLLCVAFPEARIIHVKRNAAATCWSNFKHYFNQRALAYCYDLQDLVRYFLLYKDLMQYWNKLYATRIYNFDYDELVVNQEFQIKALIKYLNLSWQEACLSPQLNDRMVKTASNIQVRREIYKGSSESWQNYKPFLNGIFDNLE